MDAPTLGPVLSTQRNMTRRRFVFAYLLFFMVGIAPWTLVTGLFAELPALVAVVPEGYGIAARMVIAVQAGNLVGFTYVVVLTCRGRDEIGGNRGNTIAVGSILVLAILTDVALVFLWDEASAIGGSRVSLALIVLTAVAGVVGCVFVVSAYPFASFYDPAFTSALSTGSGMNGLVTSLLALAQQPGNGNAQYFSPEVFFVLLGCLLAAALVCFLLIVVGGCAPAAAPAAAAAGPPPANVGSPGSGIQQTDGAMDGPLLEHRTTGGVSYESIKGRTGGAPAVEGPLLSWREVATHARCTCAHQFVICFFNYVLLAILPYAVKHYPKAALALLLYTTSGNVFGSLARFLSTFVRAFRGIWLMSVGVAAVAAFLCVASFVNDPPLLGGTAGAALLVIAATAFQALYGYEETLLFQKVAPDTEGLPDKYRAMASRFVGMANQGGAFAGSIVGFTVVVAVLET